jgi:plasmid stabilization system protein ParE
MRILLSREGEEDFLEAIEYLAEQSPRAAQRLLDRFENALATLSSGLVDGREVQLADGRNCRVWSLSPYRIYYRRDPESIEILRLYHQARRPIEAD